MNFLLDKHIKLIIFIFSIFLLLLLLCKMSEDYEIMNKYYRVKYKGIITKMWTSSDNKQHFEITPYNTSLYKKYVYTTTNEDINKYILGDRMSLNKMVPKKDVVKGYVISYEENHLYNLIFIKKLFLVFVIVISFTSFITIFSDNISFI